MERPHRWRHLFTFAFAIISPNLDHQKFPREPRDCADVLASGMNSSGIYAIHPGIVGNPFNVYCDMETDGGGWTMFQRRVDSSVDFYRNWSNYQLGFGSVSSEHWLGTDKIHQLTNQTEYELRVDLEAFDGRTRHATYKQFSVADETRNYLLTVTGYRGNAGDSLQFHDGYQFCTRERGHDIRCHTSAQTMRAGFWLGAGVACNPNGKYFTNAETTEGYGIQRIIWYAWLGYAPLKGTEMKVRPVKSMI